MKLTILVGGGNVSMFESHNDVVTLEVGEGAHLSKSKVAQVQLDPLGALQIAEMLTTWATRALESKVGES
jgi:hypothetical protein